MNTAIIVAAGSGTRFDSPTPKQFLDILGKPVIQITLERFQQCPAIDAIVAVIGETDFNRFSAIAQYAKITKLVRTVTGGQTRAESVRNGFAAVDPETAIVCVHDGVRPLVTSDEIAATVLSAELNGAAFLSTSVTDTIKTVDYGKVTGTVDRQSLRRALTPQAFRYYVLKEAIESSTLDETVTDECFMAENIGVMVTAVDGSPRNIKITNREDFVVAEAFLRAEGR